MVTSTSYGFGAVLIAEDDCGNYWVVGIVDNENEARELGRSYCDHVAKVAGVVPDTLVVHRRSVNGCFREEIAL